MDEQAPDTTTPAADTCPRPYRLGQRATAMTATRARILAAARTLILNEQALAGFSLDAVARHADITRMTVYHHFGSKRGVLEAVFDEAATRGRLDEQVPQAVARPDAVEALRAYIDTFCSFWDSERVLHRRLRGMAVLDPEFAAAIASRYARRHQAIERLLRRMHDQGSLSASTARHDLVPTLVALTSFEFYDVLAGDRSPHQVAPIIWHLVCNAIGLSP